MLTLFGVHIFLLQILPLRSCLESPSPLSLLHFFLVLLSFLFHIEMDLNPFNINFSVRYELGNLTSFLSQYHFFFNFIFYFWLRWVFVVARGLSLVAVSGGYSLLPCVGFSLRWLLLLWSTGSRAQAQQLWRMGLVAPRHVGSSRTRARTCVTCIGRWIPNHCTTREALSQYHLLSNHSFLIEREATFYEQNVWFWSCIFVPLTNLSMPMLIICSFHHCRLLRSTVDCILWGKTSHITLLC